MKTFDNEESVGLMDEEKVTSIEEIQKLTRKELLESANYSREEILSLVGLYQSLQKFRIAANNKLDSNSRKADIISHPHVVEAIRKDLYKLEKQAAYGMANYAKHQPLGRWCLSLVGVGDVTTAAILAHIDFTKCCCEGFKAMDDPPPHKCPGLSYAGQVWSFAGLTPKKPWTRGMRRPYNARLKVVLWNLGKTFVRMKNNPQCLYAQLYKARKEVEVRNNESGKYNDLAYSKLREAREGGWRISPLQKEAWGNGRLQPAGLEQRACNHAVKVFLSHFFHVGYEMLHGKEPPNLWVFEHGGEKHTRYIPPPNWPGEF